MAHARNSKSAIAYRRAAEDALFARGQAVDAAARKEREDAITQLAMSATTAVRAHMQSEVAKIIDGIRGGSRDDLEGAYRRLSAEKAAALRATGRLPAALRPEAERAIDEAFARTMEAAGLPGIASGPLEAGDRTPVVAPVPEHLRTLTAYRASAGRWEAVGRRLSPADTSEKLRHVSRLRANALQGRVGASDVATVERLVNDIRSTIGRISAQQGTDGSTKAPPWFDLDPRRRVGFAARLAQFRAPRTRRNVQREE